MMAEARGFEPLRPLRVYLISSQAHSTTLARFRGEYSAWFGQIGKNQRAASSSIVTPLTAGILMPHPTSMKRLLAVSLALLSLAGCNLWPSSEPPADDGEQTSSRPETKNVIYRGTLQELGVSIYMEGTHRLELEDGRFVLLESDGVVLDEYVGEDVEVFGATRATVEGGAIIMRVERIAKFAESSSSSASVATTTTLRGTVSDSSLGTCDFKLENGTQGPVLRGTFECGQYDAKLVEVTGVFASIEGGVDNVFDVGTIRLVSPSSASVASSVATSAATSSRVTTSRSSAVSRPPSSSSAPVVASSAASEDPLAAKVALMAKANMDASNWTQKYCSTHIGFCVPVHKNWWYTSFGATSSSLWHVEVGPSEILTLGEGPLTIVLLSGAAPSPDGTVTVDGGTAVGVRTWTNNRHFEIRASASLQAAVRYMTQELTAAPAAQ